MRSLSCGQQQPDSVATPTADLWSSHQKTFLVQKDYYRSQENASKSYQKYLPTSLCSEALLLPAKD